DDDKEHLFFGSGIRAFSLQQGDSATHFFGDPLGKGYGGVGDDGDPLGGVQPLDDEVDNAGADEYGDQRIHRLFPADMKGGQGDDGEVEDHKGASDAPIQVFLSQTGDNVHPSGGSAAAQDEAEPYTYQHAGIEGSEERVTGQWIPPSLGQPQKKG